MRRLSESPNCLSVYRELVWLQLIHAVFFNNKDRAQRMVGVMHANRTDEALALARFYRNQEIVELLTHYRFHSTPIS